MIRWRHSVAQIREEVGIDVVGVQQARVGYSKGLQRRPYHARIPIHEFHAFQVHEQIKPIPSKTPVRLPKNDHTQPHESHPFFGQEAKRFTWSVRRRLVAAAGAARWAECGANQAAQAPRGNHGPVADEAV